MHHAHIGARQPHFIGGQDIAVLQGLIQRGIEKAFPLNAGHVQDIQIGQRVFERRGLGIGDAHAVHAVDHVIGHAQRFGRDQHETDAGIAAHGGDQAVHRAPVLEVAANADGQMAQPSLFPVNGQQIGQRLSGVVVTAVPGVDHRQLRAVGRHQRRAVLGVAHGDDIGVAADGLDGIGYAFAL